MFANRRFKNLLAIAILPLVSSTAFSADYVAGFSLRTEAGHNDNIRLLPRDKIAVDKYNVAPTLTFAANTEINELRLDSTFDFNRFDKSEFNSNDQNIALTFTRQLEQGSFGFDAAYVNDSTLTSELLTSGRIGNKAERAERYQLSPRWLYAMNETNLLQVQASYTAQEYGTDAYTGYDNTGAQVSWIYKITERMSWLTTATYSDYQSDDRSINVPPYNLSLPISQTITALFPTGFFGQQSYAVRTKSKGLNFGLNYEWSEQTSIDASLGRSKNSTVYPARDPDDICGRLAAAGIIGENVGAICSPLPSAEESTSTANVVWKWQSERQQISLNGTKKTEPSSNGYALDSLQIISNWTYRLTELDQASVALTLVRNRAVDDKSSLQNASDADRDYRAATLAYQRQINEYWFLRGSYQYGNQKYPDIDYEASSNIWTLSISYRPQQWHWSR